MYVSYSRVHMVIEDLEREKLYIVNMREGSVKIIDSYQTTHTSVVHVEPELMMQLMRAELETPANTTQGEKQRKQILGLIEQLEQLKGIANGSQK